MRSYETAEIRCGPPAHRVFQTAARIKNHLLSFEKKINSAIKDMPIIGICPYSADEFSGERFTDLNALIREHSGIVFYDNENSTLLRH